MPALIWAALGLFAFVLAVGCAWLAVIALRAWREVRRIPRRMLAQMDELAQALTLLESRLERIEKRSVELRTSVEQLSVSLERARVLLAAAQELRGAVGRVRAFMPQK